MTQNDIEQVVVDYIMDHGKNPKYVLIDERSYEKFNNMAIPREKINVLGNYEPTDITKDLPTITTMWTTKCNVEILSVKSEKTILEAVA